MTADAGFSTASGVEISIPAMGSSGAVPVQQDSTANDLSEAWDKVTTKDEHLDSRESDSAARGGDDDLRGDLERNWSKEGGAASSPSRAHASDSHEALMEVHNAFAPLIEKAMREGDYAALDSHNFTLHRANLEHVQRFAEAKDAKGQLLRPHFDEVAADVMALLKAARSESRTLTLAQAYDSALWSNPATRAKVQQPASKGKEKPEPKGDSLRADLGNALSAAGYRKGG